MIEKIKRVLRYILLVEVLLIAVSAVGYYLGTTQVFFMYLGVIGAYPISFVIILYVVVWVIGKAKGD